MQTFVARIGVRWLALVLSYVLVASSEAAPPKVDHLFPAGGAAGATTTITASGEFGSWPVQVRCNLPEIQVSAEAEKSKFKITIPPQHPPGIAWLRFWNAEGASSLRPFLISQANECEEQEPNEAISNAQVVKPGDMVNGRFAKANDVDCWLVELASGETITVSLQGHALLGSPMDALLQICQLRPRGNSPDALEAFVLEQIHDVVFLDPALHFTAPNSGKYLIRALAYPSEPNSTIGFAGGDGYIYRLSIRSGRVTPTHLLPSPRDGVPRLAKEAQRFAFPAVFHGTFQAAGPREFSFSASKGGKLTFHTTTRGLGYPTEVALKILNAEGAVVTDAVNDDPRKEIELAFTPPSAGDYRLQVSELYQRTGEQYQYRVMGIAAEQFVELTVANDAFVLEKGKMLEIPITVDRRFGFSSAIAIEAQQLPPGLSAEIVTSEPKGDSAKAVKLKLTASGDAPTANTQFTIVGKSNGEHSLELPVQFLSKLPLDQPQSQLWITVK